SLSFAMPLNAPFGVYNATVTTPRGTSNPAGFALMPGNYEICFDTIPSPTRGGAPETDVSIATSSGPLGGFAVVSQDVTFTTTAYGTTFTVTLTHNGSNSVTGTIA